MAECLEHMGKKEDAQSIYRMILDIEVEFFSNMHLRELPYYQALCAEALGLQQKAWNIMARAKRDWSFNLDRKDNGFFSTTPFFISFAQGPAIARRAYYQYLLGLVKLYEGDRKERKRCSGKAMLETPTVSSVIITRSSNHPPPRQMIEPPQIVQTVQKASM